ncbi:MAG: dihydroorotate dehydrogenase [Burkholderiales bacterium]
MVDMTVRIGALTLKNPVMPGSGTMGEGLARVMDLGRLGAIVTKTITPEPREGCPPPRMVEYKDGSLMAIGIPCKGPDHYVDEILPQYRAYPTPVVCSVSAPTVDAFGRLAAKLSVAGVAAIEANISCPNLEQDGRAFGMDAEASARVVRRLKESTDRPVWAKLTPNVTDIAAVARAVAAAGADAVTCANGMLGMAVDVENFQPALGNVTGGMTGPCTRPVILRMAWQVARAVKIPVIGSGGVACARDALEYLMVGCAAVQVGTINFVHPTAMLGVIDGIEAFCRRKGIGAVRALTGAMRPRQDFREDQAA